MKFTDNIARKYNGVSKQDLIDFNKREIVYNSTQSSCLGSENAILTLENEVVFYNEKNKFFERLNKSEKISQYKEEQKIQFFFKWVQKFLVDNHKTNKGINYIFTKTNLDDLKEACIIMFKDEQSNKD